MRVRAARPRRFLAVVALSTLGLAGMGCSADGGGNEADDFTNRPGQNAPIDASSTTTTSADGGMGTAGDDTGSQVGK